MTLKSWLLGFDNAGDDEEEGETKHRHRHNHHHHHNRYVLLMDGGVSTHLERLLSLQSINDDSSESISTKGFSHRSLWSSSLLLNAKGRKIVLQGHMDWLQISSCDIITTVTYQCHFGTFEEKTSNGKEVQQALPPPIVEESTMIELLQYGVALAKEAVNDYVMTNEGKMKEKDDSENITHEQIHLQQRQQKCCYVVASSGCYGAALADGSEYTGNYGPHITYDKLFKFHYEKANVLVQQSPDGIAIETIPKVEECAVICDVLASLQQQEEEDDRQRHKTRQDSSKNNNNNNNGSTRDDGNDMNIQDVPSPAYWISLACQNDELLNDGETVVSALNIIREKDPTGRYVHAIGINCCDSLYIGPLLTIITKHMATYGPKRGIVVYPNSGEEWDARKETWRDGTGCTDSDEFASRMINAINIVHTTWKKYHHEQQQQQPQLPQINGGNNNNSEKVRSVPKLIVGGCCRTTPASIASLRAAIDNLSFLQPTKKKNMIEGGEE